MFDPFDDEDAPHKPPRPPFPTPTGALLLTFGASFASLVVAVLFFEKIDVLALGVGEALGVGGVATLAARRVPDPQPERLGLRGLSPRVLPMLLCLVPLVFLTSELDNVARTLDERMPPLGVRDALVDAPPADAPDAAETEAGGETAAAATPESATGAVDANEGTQPPASAAGHAERDAEGGAEAASADRTNDADDATTPIVSDPPQGWALVQIAIVMLGISPVVECFLFYGVILQGLVTWLGRARGLLLTGSLYALIHAFGQAGGDGGLFQALGAIAAFIGVGVVLGIARIASGSVIAPILLDTAFKGVALLAMTSPELLAVPGYNVGTDAHTPLAVLLPSAGTVAWGLWLLTRRGRGEW